MANQNSKTKLIITFQIIAIGLMGFWFWGQGGLSSHNVSGATAPIPRWTDVLKEQLTKLRDPKNITDPDFKATLDLDAEYNKYSERAVNDYVKKSNMNVNANIEAAKKMAGGENGSPNIPYYIEPNQFKKVCDQNKYVLYTSVGGASGRDMRRPKGGVGPTANENNNVNSNSNSNAPKDGNTGEESVWRVPTCEELAQCHCCINTCMDTVLRTVKIGKKTITYIVCLPNVGFGPMGCSPMCKAPIARTACSSYSAPTHSGAFDRDCMGRANGCESPGGCEVIIKDPGNSQFEFAPPNSETYTKSKRGDNAVPPGGKVKKTNGASVLDYGWIGQLSSEPGKCCKCIQNP